MIIIIGEATVRVGFRTYHGAVDVYDQVVHVIELPEKLHYTFHLSKCKITWLETPRITEKKS